MYNSFILSSCDRLRLELDLPMTFIFPPLFSFCHFSRNFAYFLSMATISDLTVETLRTARTIVTLAYTEQEQAIIQV